MGDTANGRHKRSPGTELGHDAANQLRRSDSQAANSHIELPTPKAAKHLVVLFFLFGDHWLTNINSAVQSALPFAWLFAVILWCAFEVVEEADHLAELLHEPLGTIILALATVIIEFALISAMALGGKSSPTLGRDTMFAVLMIILNAGVGLCLLLGSLRHHQQAYNLPGATAYLGIIIPLSVIALVLPNFMQTGQKRESDGDRSIVK